LIGGILGGVIALLLLLGLLILIVVLVRRKNENRLEKAMSVFSENSSLGFEMNQSQHEALRQRPSNVYVPAAESTLLNTQIEVSLPGFLMINTATQIRKEEQIGSGGCAIIYRGVILDDQLVKKFDSYEVAVKDIFDNPKCTKDENFLQFQQEVMILWRCSAIPNVMKLIGYSPEPKSLVTKLYETDLYKLIHTKEIEITPNMALSIAFDIANGMRAVHQAQVVHRDLKSPNIFLETLRATGRSFLRAVIGDFGLARIATDLVIDLHKEVNVQGLSPRYTAPEVFSRFKSGLRADIPDEMRSDVYSYSIILWELLMRKKPWEGLKEVSEIEAKVCNGQREAIPPPLYMNHQILSLLQQVIIRCWSQNPFERPTFANLAEKLDLGKSGTL